MPSSIVTDPELGTLTWNGALEWWEGSVTLTGEAPCQLCVFARASLTSDRSITSAARAAVARLRDRGPTSREFATEQLLPLYNSEWATGRRLSPAAFASRLTPEGIEVHESGYAELHFRAGDLFEGHGVGVRLYPNGSFQEAVIEG